MHTQHALPAFHALESRCNLQHASQDHLTMRHASARRLLVTQTTIKPALPIGCDASTGTAMHTHVSRWPGGYIELQPGHKNRRCHLQAGAMGTHLASRGMADTVCTSLTEAGACCWLCRAVCISRMWNWSSAHRGMEGNAPAAWDGMAPGTQVSAAAIHRCRSCTGVKAGVLPRGLEPVSIASSLHEFN